MILPLLLMAAPVSAPMESPREIRTEDMAMLSSKHGMLFNNVCFKGDIRGAKQQIFREKEVCGWTWDWPEGTGPGVKTYPEIIQGRSPWGAAKDGDLLPCPLSKARMKLDFDFQTEGTGSWCTSFDFWITSKPEPTSKDIVFNFTVWTQIHALANTYKGKHEQVKIGGRGYQAIFETPVEAPWKIWSTLCLVEDDLRNSGSLDVGAIVDFLLARGLVKPDQFLATAELGSEVVCGKGSLTLRTFALKPEHR